MACEKPKNSVEITAKTSTTQSDSITQKTLINHCDNLIDQLKKINHSSKIETLMQANVDIKKCLPKLNKIQIYQVLDASTQMYQQFLETKSGNESMEGLNAYGYVAFYPENAKDLGQGNVKTIKKSLPQRDQYLIDQIGKEYIQFLDIGEGLFELKRHPQYVADYFAASLPPADAEFIRRMAKDNTDILYSDSAISIPRKELAQRALFWEKYIAQYPKSRLIHDAKFLLNEYQNLIFLGSDNSPTFEFHDHRFHWADPEAKQAIEWLTEQPDTQVTLSAQYFLEMMAESYPQLNTKNSEPYDLVKKHLNLKQISDNRECHSDALCYDTP
ncbi:hypothetical protein [Acinetobacter sp. ANC 3832]|uniref:hypothetical protein n=1 Tax=Acinetobacter sp. ANC 3832 TaxID=1977874 RepID=UPI000A32C407|nr:hypothetical protein [Acinetobacter sp. ANC 3832]OTG91684.1 hypothetical protein B9T35_14075 [Acinetobacter sp. ANC 3832]